MELQNGIGINNCVTQAKSLFNTQMYWTFFFLHLAEFQVTPGRRTVKTFSQGNRWISEDQRKAVEDVTENKISYLSECNCNL